jgi:hypothetical protein
MSIFTFYFYGGSQPPSVCWQIHGSRILAPASSNIWFHQAFAWPSCIFNPPSPLSLSSANTASCSHLCTRFVSQNYFPAVFLFFLFLHNDQHLEKII